MFVISRTTAERECRKLTVRSTIFTLPPVPRFLRLFLLAIILTAPLCAAVPDVDSPLPVPLDRYHETPDAGLLEIIRVRIDAVPFNLAASIIFFLAICHTFLTAKFRHWAHVAEEKHAAKLADRPATRTDADDDGEPVEVSFMGQVLHFLGEVEAVFGIWVLVLAGAIGYYFGWSAVLDYIGQKANFTEPMFVVVIMALAGTRPILRFAEICLRKVANIGKCTTGAWWLAILIVAPLLGSFITEPAAMTIGALLLARQFYALKAAVELLAHESIDAALVDWMMLR
ncbi:MAG: hypothetical protein EXS32_11885 [Opitutus sp.]|nr:hypothetical protein [Opitutus sp.]